jgi:hypothetical protein
MAAEHRYWLHGVRIASDLALTDLQPDIGHGEPHVRIELGAVPAAPRQGVPLPAGRIHWDGQRLLFSVPGLARFAITAHEIRIERDSAANPETLQMLLLGSAWGACCHLRGHLLLHASAALIGNECIAFLGNSGAGKSTLAALLAARGHRVAADDTCVLVGGRGATQLHPGPRQVKLWHEGLPLLAGQASDVRPAALQPGKFKLSLDAHWLEQSQPIQRLLLLDCAAEGRPAGFTRLDALDAMQALAAHTFRPKLIALLGCQQRHFALCAAVNTHTGIYRWIRPWGLERRLQMLAMLEAWLETPPPTQPPHVRGGVQQSSVSERRFI